MANLVPRTKCGKWLQCRCVKLKRVTSTLEKGFICERCVEAIKRNVEPAKKLTFYLQVELAKSYCYFGDSLNASDASERVVSARTRIGWLKLENVGKCLMEESFC